MRERGCPGLAARASASAHSLPSCIEPHTRTSPPPSQPPLSLSLTVHQSASLSWPVTWRAPCYWKASNGLSFNPHHHPSPPHPHTSFTPPTRRGALAAHVLVAFYKWRCFSEVAVRAGFKVAPPVPLLLSSSPPPLKLPSYPAYRSVSALQTRTALPIAPFAGASAGTWLASVSGISLVTCPLDLTLIALRWQTNHSRAYQS